MSVKRPNVLSLIEKSEVVEQLRKGSSVTSLAKKYNVAKSTICGYKKKSEKILNCVNNAFSGPGKRKTLRTSEFPKMEKSLYRWFLTQRDKNYAVNGSMIKERAKLLHKKFNEGDGSFNASDGWLQRFKTRYGVRFIKITGEKLSSHPELVEPFQNILHKKIQELNLCNDQIYNAVESGLFWKLLPNKTYVASSKKNAPGRKLDKQRIAFLVCANANGSHKLKPLVIGKAKNPRSFRNCICPLDYKSSKASWMTAVIFKDWFHQSFVPQVKSHLKSQGLPIKALLLLDNAPSHPPESELTSEDGCITAMFMPPHVPMDQNAIRITKLYYRNSLLSSIVAEQTDVSEALKKLTLKDAILNLNAAWNRLERPMLAKCWHNILNLSENFDDDADDPLSILKVENTVQLLHSLNPEVEYTGHDIREWNEDHHGNIVTEGNISSEESVSECLSEPRRERVKPSEVIECLNKVLEWGKNEIISENDMAVLRRLREKATMTTLCEKKEQKRMTDFFH